MKKKLSKILFFRILLHLFRWLFFKNQRTSFSLIYPNFIWHDRYSVFLATYFYWIFKPLAIFLVNKKILFSVNNISDSIGHVYPEVDYLLRLKKTDDKVKGKSIFYIYPKNPVLTGFVKAVGYSTEVKFILSGFLHLLIWPLLMRYPELTISTAHGSYNYSIDRSKRLLKVIYPNYLSYTDVFRDRQKKYVQLRAQTLDYYPLKTDTLLPNELVEMIGQSKYIVIQIKTESVNGAWQACDPSTYIDALKEIISEGYKVVFAGREKMPEIFKKLGVINYSESKNATAMNDYFLVLNASGVIASVSGFSYIPDVLDIPLLTINTLFLATYPGRKTINIPSLLSKDKAPMKFKEQLEYLYDRGQITNENIVTKDINCKDASAEDILLAFKELYIIIEKGYISPLSDLQLEFNNHFPLEIMSSSPSSISHSFIKKHRDRY
jgi:putative glycosyltransferase (TIGR04372 family)